METFKVYIGSVTSGNTGITLDTTREVEFTGEELAEFCQAGTHKGAVTDTRGTMETLYRAEDGRLIVHAKEWSHWQGEPTVYTLQEVTAEDLGPAGRFAFLGEKAGLGRPLTLDEALNLGLELAEDYD